MRQAIVQWTRYNQPAATFLILENLNDWLEYVEEQTDVIQEDLQKVIKSQVDPERWDHFPNRNIAVATSIAKVRESSPISEVSRLVERKHSTMAEMINDGEVLLVNECGGFCPMMHDHVILESWEYNKPSRQVVSIADNPSYINLENDPDLETRTHEFFKENNFELSYVCNLHCFSKDDLIDVFNDLHEKGGYGLYVLTTGMNVQQMYEYSDALLASNLANNVIFEFTAAITYDIRGVIRHLKSKGASVTVLNEEE